MEIKSYLYRMVVIVVMVAIAIAGIACIEVEAHDKELKEELTKMIPTPIPERDKVRFGTVEYVETNDVPNWKADSELEYIDCPLDEELQAYIYWMCDGYDLDLNL